MPRREPKYKVVMPPVPKHCTACGRKMDSRIFDNPYGMWSLPSLDGATGVWRCAYCHDLSQGKDRLLTLPPDCKGMAQLKAWLALPGGRK